MSTLSQIILANLIISLLSLSGILVILFKEKILQQILLILVSLSAGVLLGDALLHLIPEALIGNDLTKNSLTSVFVIVILGILFFFVLEQFLTWHHCHNTSHKHSTKPVSLLILVGDSVHNFIDGLAIAASFLVSPATGIATTMAISFHEIPQEIGDFGVLVYSGYSKSKALAANFFTAVTALIGGIIGFYFIKDNFNISVWLLAFTAGNFIYISSADLIPEIKHQDHSNRAVVHLGFFVIGILIMLALRYVGK